MTRSAAQSALTRCARAMCGCGLIVLAAVAGACHQRERAEFGDDDPATRITAIRDAAIAKDAARVPELIESLYSEDGAERFLAIRTLESMTGQTLGYDHAAPPAARRAAADRWADWYHARQGNAPAAVEGGRDTGATESATNP